MIYEDLYYATNALKCTFEIYANQQGVRGDELVIIRQEIVKRDGKYSNSWKTDWLAKLAFDYWYCIEMLSVLEEEGELSYKRRVRLYRFVTMNEHIKTVWDELPELSANSFLDRTERDLLKVKKHRRYK
jgi:hypothetical protein